MSTFEEVLAEVRDLLQREGRVAYRVLKRRFSIDDEYIEDLKADLIDAKRIATDEDGKVLVWVQEQGAKSREHRAKQEEEERSNTQSASLAPRSLLPTSQATAERRQLTVMFIDLVGSTTLSQQLDPEDYHGRVVAYQTACHQVIARYEGHIAQYLGDGVLVYFGYPVAHEDDAVRAVRSGLEIVEALRHQVPSPRQGEGQGEVRLQVRIGIHTGLVVVGEIGSSEKREILALGETPNLAARIQGQAQPDEVIISAASYRLVEGLFDTEERGQPELKGVATPLTLYRVTKGSEAHSRFEVVVRKGLTPLVGREHEYGLLQDRWQRVQDGAGQIVLLSGEPGIGKSRLVEALKERVEHEGARCLELRCSPYAQNSALQPVIEHLQRTLQFRPEDSAEEKLQKLIVGATGRSPLQTEAVPLLASLLSLPAPRSVLPALSPQKQKEKTYEVLVAWLCAEAKHQAVVYVWEDLHWADPSALELLTLFLQQIPTTRLLTVLTFRPEFTPPWDAHSYLSHLSLSRLGRNYVETMVEKVTGGTVLPSEVVQQIVSKTDGVPLFVEELTKSVIENMRGQVTRDRLQEEGKATGVLPAAPVFPLGIPTTLQDALMARLDRLGTAKELAQLGATLGREFSYDLLHAVSRVADSALQHGLRQLVDAELLYQRGLPPQATYLFKHTLVQDTAYQSLLKSRRQQLHQQVAYVLAERFSQTVEIQPELVAHHYTEAGLIEQAIPYWQQAGQRASQRSANAEAIAYLTKGLELLKTLPNTPMRSQHELALYITLGPALMAAKGYSAPEVEQAYARAMELCRQVEQAPRLLSASVGLYLFYANRGQFHKVFELTEPLLSIAPSEQTQTVLLGAHGMLGVACFWLGDFAAAQAHLTQCATLYTPQENSSRSFFVTADLRVDFFPYAAWSLWMRGYPDRALTQIYEILSLAQELSHPFTVAYALTTVIQLHLLRREGQAVQARAEELMTLAREQDFPYWIGAANLFGGWALAVQGQGAKGIVQTRNGLDALRSMGTELGVTWFSTLLAEAYGKGGRTPEGLSVLNNTLAVMQEKAERVYEAELYRLKGEFLLETRGQNLSESEGYFQRAIETTRRQSAKSFELRAATSLARLWQQRSKRAEAHKLLSEMYNWFTEGFDTKDLQEAKALLEELT